MKSQLPVLFVLLLIFCQPTYGLGATAGEVDEEVKAATLVSTGQAAPDFTCKTTDGKSIPLSALKGKVVVVYFFSARVFPSLTQMKYLEEEVHQKLRSRGDFQLIGIGSGDTREEVVRVGGERKITFPLAADPAKEICGRYFSKYTPRTVVVGKNGRIAHLENGYHEYNSIPKLQAVLARELAMQSP